MARVEGVMKAFLKAFVVLVLLFAVTGGIVAYSIASKGLSTRTIRSPAKLREAEEARLFLEGMTEAPANRTPAKPHHD